MNKGMAVNMSVICAMEEARKRGEIIDCEELYERRGFRLTEKEHRQYVFLCQQELKLRGNSKFYKKQPVVRYIEVEE